MSGRALILVAGFVIGCGEPPLPPGSHAIGEVPGYPYGLFVDGGEVIVPGGTAEGPQLLALSLADGATRPVAPLGNGAHLFAASGGEALYGDESGLWWVGPEGRRQLATAWVSAATVRDRTVWYAGPPSVTPDPSQPASIIHADASLWTVPVEGGPAVEQRSGLHFIDDIAVEAGEFLYTQRVPTPWKDISSPAWVARSRADGDTTWAVPGWMVIELEPGDGRPWAILARFPEPGCRLTRWDPSTGEWAVLLETEQYCSQSDLAVRGGVACFTEALDWYGDSLTCWSDHGMALLATRRAGIMSVGIGDGVVVWADRPTHRRAAILLVADLP